MDTYELTIVGCNMIATASLIVSIFDPKRKRVCGLVLTTLFTGFGAAFSVYRNQTLITPIPVPYVLILYLAKEAVTGLVLAAALTLYIWLYCDNQKKMGGYPTHHVRVCIHEYSAPLNKLSPGLLLLCACTAKLKHMILDTQKTPEKQPVCR